MVKTIKEITGINVMTINNFKAATGIKGKINKDTTILYDNDLYRYDPELKGIRKLNKNKLIQAEIGESINDIDIQVYLQ